MIDTILAYSSIIQQETPLKTIDFEDFRAANSPLRILFRILFSVKTS